ncbi:MAG: hypothetical protein AAFP22_17475 [Planctomycetota bacterium]
MHAAETLRRFETVHADWQRALEARPDGDFIRPFGPQQGGFGGARPGQMGPRGCVENTRWELGRVCDHVVAAGECFLDEVDGLARGDGTVRRASPVTWLVFGAAKRLPPVRVEVPKGLPERYARVAAPEPLERGAALERLGALAGRMRAAREAVESVDPRLRSRHPVMSWLNAREWYQLVEMHTRHHGRQLRRTLDELDATRTA